MVCDAVNVTFATMRPDVKRMASTEGLYEGHGYLATATARFFVFRTLHDIYGFSYSELSSLSNIKMRRVMRAVKKIRDGIFLDPLYKQIKNEIDKRVTDGLL